MSTLRTQLQQFRDPRYGVPGFVDGTEPLCPDFRTCRRMPALDEVLRDFSDCTVVHS